MCQQPFSSKETTLIFFWLKYVRLTYWTPIFPTFLLVVEGGAPFFKKNLFRMTSKRSHENYLVLASRHSWPSDPTRSCLSEYVFVYVCLWFVFEFVLWIVFVFYIYVCPPWVGLVVIPPGAVSPSQHVMTGCTRKLSKARLLLTAHDTLRIYHVSHVIFYFCLRFDNLQCRKS